MSARLEDDERDAHLRAALRHAPDHDTSAPAPLSRQILDAARRAVEPAARTPWASTVRRMLASALDALTRPAGAAAFASLVLVTVIGLMWRDGPPPEAMSDRTSAPGVAPAAPSSLPSSPPVAAAEPGAREALPRSIREAPATARQRAPDEASAAKPQAEPKRRATTPAATDAEPAERAGGEQRSRAAAAGADVARPQASARDEARLAANTTDAAPRSAGDVAPPSPPPRREARTSAPSAAAEPTTADAAAAALASPKAVPRHAPFTEASPATATAPAAPPAAVTRPSASPSAKPSAPSTADPATLRSALAPVAPDPLAPVLNELARDASAAPSATTYHWQRGSAAAMPHGPIAQAWLAELQRATHGAWQPTQAAMPAGAGDLALGNERGPVGRLALVGNAVWWHSAAAPGVVWRAPLPEPTLKRLHESLASWAGR